MYRKAALKPKIQFTTEIAEFWSKLRFGELAQEGHCRRKSVRSKSIPRMAGFGPLALRRSGLQGERVQFAAHFGLERFVDELVLLHAGLAAEGL